MKIRTLAVAAAAMSLASAPAVAEISLDRSAAPVEGESEIGAAAGVLGALALARGRRGFEGVDGAASVEDPNATRPVHAQRVAYRTWNLRRWR